MGNYLDCSKLEIHTSSAVLADAMKRNHESVLQLIKRNLLELGEFGEIIVKKENKIGRPKKVYYFNEEQGFFLILLMRSDHAEVIKLKKDITREYFRMKKNLCTTLTMLNNEQWEEMSERMEK